MYAAASAPVAQVAVCACLQLTVIEQLAVARIAWGKLKLRGPIWSHLDC